MAHNSNYKFGVGSSIASRPSTSRATPNPKASSVSVSVWANINPPTVDTDIDIDRSRSRPEAGIGNYNVATTSATSDFDSKIKGAIGRVSENIHITANEPSLAFFCIQEHIRKEVPRMIQLTNEFSRQHRLLQGKSYDCDYSIAAVKSIEKSGEQFESIQNHLRNLLFLKQQVRYNEIRLRQ